MDAIKLPVRRVLSDIYDADGGRVCIEMDGKEADQIVEALNENAALRADQPRPVESLVEAAREWMAKEHDIPLQNVSNDGRLEVMAAFTAQKLAEIREKVEGIENPGRQRGRFHQRVLQEMGFFIG